MQYILNGFLTAFGLALIMASYNEPTIYLGKKKFVPKLDKSERALMVLEQDLRHFSSFRGGGGRLDKHG